ncbi:1-deoxy-D-xylulose-5-phosphate reductoisomerase [Lachnoclostridium sp.]|uniref:1-deoxy-D-xylulose-5-phosphate reductoisomerase n=1 Tax=Lachnoclostridium sp. TaxID=2028282 RepID=UPI00289A8BEC|nr:1-deoxy-D-xylulose-5-phosphate reductoisomerase [Lachnoclostridium sp.]
MKIISVLGSTGSIGTQTLEVVRNNKDLQVSALAASSNIQLLEEQIREFHPKLVCVYDRDRALELKKRISDLEVIVEAGMDGLIACATEESADIVVSSVVGMIGIKPVMEAILRGKDIAFANKETLVTAGHIIMPLVKKKNVNLLPVDSEHSAIFQCLQGNEASTVSRIILTASGGPFRGKSLAQLKNVKVEDALKHPNWSMGRKITIDSATMVNKGLEVMEAHWLFNEPLDKIEVVIQPQSIIHSAVEFEDGGIIAQLGTPDMKLPIQYALYYPEKRRYLPGKRLDFFDIGQITFEKPDINNLPGLRLAYEAMSTGHSVPTVFNAANELAVAKFLNREISFLSITELIEKSMENVAVVKKPTLDEILNVEQETYDFIERECVKSNYHI